MRPQASLHLARLTLVRGRNAKEMLDKLRDTFSAVSADALAITRLELELGYLKLADYDRLARAQRGLRNVISTLERNVDDLSARLEEREKRVEKLQAEYKALQVRESSDVKASTDGERLALFKKLEPLATQLPTLHQSIKEGAEVSAGDVLELLAPLDELLSDLGFTAIGKAGAKLTFDPTRHRAVGKGARSVELGDPVRVRYVGYLYEGEVVVKAHVTAIQD